ncbi:hypothetical protein [Chitinimonas koreensis]|nr:hypothetical protein [Chitinimonas koreensis]QNM98810.1 hypothetical protein H9L41_11730 [Chitinimonas koreensis]
MAAVILASGTAGFTPGGGLDADDTGRYSCDTIVKGNIWKDIVAGKFSL